jgi:hypothetical protein
VVLNNGVLTAYLILKNLDIMDKVEKVEIDHEKNRFYIYYVKDNSTFMSNPPPPPSYYREIYSFDNLKLVETEHAKVKRAFEEVKYDNNK